jgi:DNA-binding GntR family transcriptional regulator
MDNGLDILSFSAPFARTLSDQVAGQLRQAILQGRLKPGQRIIEHEIAQAMAISRGPVRDALRILQNERLVVQYPHRGAFVAWLTLRDAEEIYSLRRELETLAVEFAIKYATDEQIEELTQVIEKMMAVMKQGYAQPEATDLDLDFHETLCRISGHGRVLAAWTALRAQVRLIILTHGVLQPMDLRENAAEWHRMLVDAVRKRDVEAAHEVLRRHLAASYASVRQAIEDGKLEQVIAE